MSRVIGPLRGWACLVVRDDESDWLVFDYPDGGTGDVLAREPSEDAAVRVAQQTIETSAREHGRRVEGWRLNAPTLHLNGSGAESLINGYADAAFALDEAIGKVCETAPNQRDYYVQDDPAAFERARGEHESRIRRMRAVVRELEWLAQSVGEQRDEREARRHRR